MIGYDFFNECSNYFDYYYEKASKSKEDKITSVDFNICGRPFNLEVDLAPDYDKDSDKTFIFKSLNKIYNNRERISKNITSNLPKRLRDYMMKDAYSDKDKIEEKITNPFKYIKPTGLYICSPIVYTHAKAIGGIMCNYKFDPEHGIVITLSSSGMKNIAPQDRLL